MPVEGFARLSEKAMFLFDNNIKDYMWAMTLVLLGVNPEQVNLVNWQLHFPGRTDSRFFAGEQLLPYMSDDPSLSRFGDDWALQYRDGSSSQARHFWFYVSLAYYNNAVVSLAGNAQHDPVWTGGFLGFTSSIPFVNALAVGAVAYAERREWINTKPGISEEDFNLGIAGAVLGSQLRRIPSLTNPSDWIRQNLGNPYIAGM